MNVLPVWWWGVREWNGWKITESDIAGKRTKLVLVTARLPKMKISELANRILQRQNELWGEEAC